MSQNTDPERQHLLSQNNGDSSLRAVSIKL
jgi:hypothetical protein